MLENTYLLKYQNLLKNLTLPPIFINGIHLTASALFFEICKLKVGFKYKNRHNLFLFYLKRTTDKWNI